MAVHKEAVEVEEGEGIYDGLIFTCHQRSGALQLCKNGAAYKQAGATILIRADAALATKADAVPPAISNKLFTVN